RRIAADTQLSVSVVSGHTDRPALHIHTSRKASSTSECNRVCHTGYGRRRQLVGCVTQAELPVLVISPAIDLSVCLYCKGMCASCINAYPVLGSSYLYRLVVRGKIPLSQLTTSIASPSPYCAVRLQAKAEIFSCSNTYP